MICKCIRGEYCFDIKYVKDKILYYDLSNWMEEYGGMPDSYTFTINDKEFEVNPNLPNVLDITDGIYCFTFNNCGTEYTITYPILSELSCKLSELWSEDEESATELFILIKQMESECDKDKLKELYKIAKRYVESC